MAVNLDRIVQRVLAQYELPWDGAHGLSHWGRVLENGLLLAERTGANPDVVTLFALFHDSRRQDEGTDPDHGQRGAAFAASQNGELFDLTPRDLRLLVRACELHSRGRDEGDVTVRTCWDADRLDLGRVGIRPDPKRLSTPHARDRKLLAVAYERSIASW